MWQYNYTYPNELYHYGVKGMKWKNHTKVYDDSLLGTEKKINAPFLGEKTVVKPGQLQKAYDKHVAKRAVRKTVDATNRYKWNEKKSASENAKHNIKIFKRRRAAKKKGYKAVDKLFKHL